MTADDIVALVHERDDLQRRQDEITARIQSIDNKLGGSLTDDRYHAVLDAVAARHRVSIHRLKTGGRCAAMSAVRHEAAWELRQLTPPPSYPQIARMMGLKNHTSAIHAVRRHQARIAAQVSTPATNGSGKGDDVTR